MKKEHKYLLYGGIGLAAVITTIVLIAKHRNKTMLQTSSNLIVVKGVSGHFAKSNAAFLASLNPSERQNFINFIADIEKMGYAVVITSAYRSTAKQIEQKKADKRNATPGFSSHEYGIALDINLVKDGKWINKDSSIDTWKKTGVVDLAKRKYNFRWGGEFPGYSDTVHFDEGNKFNANKLHAQAMQQFGSLNKIEGNKMKLVA